jgi:hypothetical protein
LIKNLPNGSHRVPHLHGPGDAPFAPNTEYSENTTPKPYAHRRKNIKIKNNNNN